MKDNKLLAEYMGNKVKEFTWHDSVVLIPEHSDPITDNLTDIYIWNPKTDWNQLMMVVEKIEGEDEWIDVSISRNHCCIDKGDSTIVPTNWQIKTKIEAVYNACVEYIKSK